MPQLRNLLLQRIVLLGHLSSVIQDELKNGSDEQNTLGFAITAVELSKNNGSSMSTVEKLRATAAEFAELIEHFQNHDTEEFSAVISEIGSIADLLELIEKEDIPAIKNFLQNEVDVHRESADSQIESREFFRPIEPFASVVPIRSRTDDQWQQLYRSNLEIFELFLRMFDALYPDK